MIDIVQTKKARGTMILMKENAWNELRDLRMALGGLKMERYPELFDLIYRDRPSYEYFNMAGYPEESKTAGIHIMLEAFERLFRGLLEMKNNGQILLIPEAEDKGGNKAHTIDACSGATTMIAYVDGVRGDEMAMPDDAGENKIADLPGGESAGNADTD